MPVHVGAVTIVVDSDLLPQLARALRALQRENIRLEWRTDLRLEHLQAELDVAATEYLTDPTQVTYYTTAQAAKVMHCSPRSVRRQATELGAIGRGKPGSALYYPRDVVDRWVNRGTL